MIPQYRNILFTYALIASLALALPVSAEKGAEIYIHEHREVHTATTTTTSDSTSTHEHTETHSQTASRSSGSSETRTSQSSSGISTKGSSFNHDDVIYYAGKILFPKMKDRHLQYSGSAYPGILGEEYDRNFKDGVLAAVRAGNGKWGLIDFNGRFLVQPAYKSLSYAGQGCFYVTGKKGLSYITKTGSAASLPVRQSLAPAAFKEKGLWGFKDTEGQVILPPAYKEIYTDFHEGIAFVRNIAGEKVAIDEKGKELFAAPYDRIYPFKDGLAEFQRNVSKFNWGSVVGILVSSYYGTGYDGSTMGGFTRDNIKRGYLDTAGRVVISSKNDMVFAMTPWGTFVENNGGAGFVNRRGEYIFGPGNYDPVAGSLNDFVGLASLKNKDSGKFGVIDLNDGTAVIPFDYDEIAFLGNSRILLKQDNKKYVVDEKNGAVLAELPAATRLLPFGVESYTWSIDKNKVYRIIDTDGAVLYTAPAKAISDASPFRNGLTVVKQGDVYGIMDTKGNWLIQPRYKEIHLM